MRIRKSVVAGQFYSINKETLRSQIEDFIKKVDVEITSKPLVIIVPHAGYDYSGFTAACAYKQIINKDYSTVIIIGPSHYLTSKMIGVYPEGYFETPLGQVEIDSDLSNKIINKNKIIKKDFDLHEMEHSIEVQIPFLQVALKEFKIVPICMGDQSLTACKILSEVISDIIDVKKTLIVASSDFYHGYDYKECKKSLDASISAISSFSIEKFYDMFTKHAACGGSAIITAMLISKKLGYNNVHLLHYTNSNDVMGVIGGYVVGYASFAFTTNNHFLSKEEQEYLLRLAREGIITHLSGEKYELPIEVKYSRLKEKHMCFVTLKKKDKVISQSGYLSAEKPVYIGVIESAIEAIKSAEITQEELKEIKIEIAILSEFVPIKTIEEINIEKEGVCLKHDDKISLIFPQTVKEQGLDKFGVLEYLSLKAGLPKEKWKSSKLYKFDVQLFTG